MLSCRFLNIIGIAMFSSAVQADVLFVDVNCAEPGGAGGNPFCAIQAAIDAARDGDEIVVAPGTYFESIDLLGKVVTLRSSGGPQLTIIDAGGLPDPPAPVTCVTCNSGEGPDTVIEGFTVTGGIAVTGGGMRNNGASPTVIGCVFLNNVVDGFNGMGGGMYNENGSPTVIECTFIGNTALGMNAGSGAGMYNEYANPTVIACTFKHNTAPLSLGSGGGMFNSHSDPVIANCLFHANGASSGSGLTNLMAAPTITNCSFVDNIGATAISNFSSSSVLVNCILWANEFGQMADSATPSTVSYSDVQGGWFGTGNIDADPVFVDPENGDFRLSAGSPAIDAGHNWAIAGISGTDLGGNPRFAADEDEFDPGCGVPVVVDMGAIEYLGEPFAVSLGDIDGDGLVGITDFLKLLEGWGSCARACCLSDIDRDGTVGILDLLALLGNWG